MFTCHHCGKVYSDELLKDCSGHKYCSDCYFKYSLADEQQSVTYTPKPAPQIIKPVDSESTNAQPRENAAEVPPPAPFLKAPTLIFWPWALFA